MLWIVENLSTVYFRSVGMKEICTKSFVVEKIESTYFTS